MIDGNTSKSPLNSLVVVEIDGVPSLWSDSKTGDLLHTEARAWGIHGGLLKAGSKQIASATVFTRSEKPA